MIAFDAIVLAGGASTRMGGPDKLAIEVGGKPLLDRVIEGARDAGARTIVVVGPERTTRNATVRWTVEDPPGGGPVPAIAAGLAALDHHDDAPVVVLAGDLPFAASAGLIARLLGALTGRDASLLVDPTGRDQYLVSAYRRVALRKATSPARGRRLAGAAVQMILDGLRVARVDAVTDEEALDCDTPDEVERARQLLSRRRD